MPNSPDSKIAPPTGWNFRASGEAESEDLVNELRSELEHALEEESHGRAHIVVERDGHRWTATGDGEHEDPGAHVAAARALTGVITKAGYHTGSSEFTSPHHSRSNPHHG